MDAVAGQDARDVLPAHGVVVGQQDPDGIGYPSSLHTQVPSRAPFAGEADGKKIPSYQKVAGPTTKGGNQ